MRHFDLSSKLATHFLMNRMLIVVICLLTDCYVMFHLLSHSTNIQVQACFRVHYGDSCMCACGGGFVSAGRELSVTLQPKSRRTPFSLCEHEH